MLLSNRHYFLLNHLWISSYLPSHLPVSLFLLIMLSCNSLLFFGLWRFCNIHSSWNKLSNSHHGLTTHFSNHSTFPGLLRLLLGIVCFNSILSCNYWFNYFLLGRRWNNRRDIVLIFILLNIAKKILWFRFYSFFWHYLLLLWFWFCLNYFCLYNWLLDFLLSLLTLLFCLWLKRKVFLLFIIIEKWILFSCWLCS